MNLASNKSLKILKKSKKNKAIQNLCIGFAKENMVNLGKTATGFNYSASIL